MVDIETSQEMTRAEVAAYLRQFADKLDARGTQHTQQTHQAQQTQHTEGGRPVEETRQGQTTARDTPSSTETGQTTQTSADTTQTSTESTSEESGAAHHARYDKLTFFVGNDSTTINPPETMRFDIAVDDDSAMLTSGNRRSVDFHLEWDTDVVEDDGSLHIE